MFGGAAATMVGMRRARAERRRARGKDLA